MDRGTNQRRRNNRHPNLDVSIKTYTEPQPDYEPFDMTDQYFANHLSSRTISREEHITLTNRMCSLMEQWATNHPDDISQYEMTGYEEENVRRIDPKMKRISKRSLSTTPQGDNEEPYIIRKKTVRQNEKTRKIGGTTTIRITPQHLESRINRYTTQRPTKLER